MRPGSGTCSPWSTRTGNDGTTSGSGIGVIWRQPVFDEKGRLWGYELFCLGSTDNGFQGLPEPENAAISIESSAYIALQQILDNHKKIIVDFTEKAILDRLPYALPPALTGIRVAEAACRQAPVMEALHRLKAEGYLIVAGGFSADLAAEPIYTAADIIAIDTGGKDNDSGTGSRQGEGHDSVSEIHELGGRAGSGNWIKSTTKRDSGYVCGRLY